MNKTITILMTLLLSLMIILHGCSSRTAEQAISSDGVKINYSVQGQGEPALVLVHGWCCDKDVWKYQVSYFEKSHKVVTIDLGGHGQSGLGREDWTMEMFGEDVAAVIEKLNLKKVILVGHSMGGPVIVAAARLMPERVIALVGADTFHNIEKGYTKEEIAGMVARLETDFVTQTDIFARRMFPADADPNLVEWTAAKISSASLRVAVSSLRNLGDYDLKGAFKGLNVPVHSISSDFWPTDSEINEKYIESFEVKMIPGVGHFVMLEDPQKFNKYLEEIINELGK